MTGIVDEYGRALVRITVRHPETSVSAELDAWVDTGFTGELLLTPTQVDGLALPRSAAVSGALADGSQTQFETCRCFVDWLGVSRPVAAILGSGRFALVGVGLLEDLLVCVDYPGRKVSLTAAGAVMQKEQ